MTIRFIDLFCGLGGFHQALKSINAKCVFASDWNKFAQKTYLANFQIQPHGDITKVNEKDIPKFDLLTGGFPCQPFSIAGKREGFKHPTQGTLFYDIYRILKYHRPKAFILENVKNLKFHDKGRTINMIFKSLNSLDYYVYAKVLNSNDYGVPQIRRRIFIVGFDKNRYDSKFRFPKPTKRNNPIGPHIQYGVHGYDLTMNCIKNYLFSHKEYKPSIIDKNTMKPANTLCATYERIQRQNGNFVRDPLTKNKIRFLSQEECKIIMGLPSDFFFPVSRKQMYIQCGNSVAVPVVEALVDSVYKKILS